jgi:hypothetical protein
MKHWAAVITTIGLLLLFAGCGGGSDNADDGEAGTWDSMVWDRDTWQ